MPKGGEALWKRLTLTEQWSGVVSGVHEESKPYCCYIRVAYHVLSSVFIEQENGYL